MDRQASRVAERLGTDLCVGAGKDRLGVVGIGLVLQA